MNDKEKLNITTELITELAEKVNDCLAVIQAYNDEEL